MHRSVLEDAEFAAWANENVVVMVGHSRGGHGTVDVSKPAKGEPKTQCSLYPGLTCDQHADVLDDAKEGGDRLKDVFPPTGGGKSGGDDAKPAKKKDKKEKKDAPPPMPRVKFDGVPASFVIKPDGTTVDHKGARDPAGCRSFLEAEQKAFEENPIPASKLADVKAGFAEADKAMKLSKWKDALTAMAKAESAVGGKLPKPWAAKVAERAEAINAKAIAKLADAKRAKDPAKFAKSLRDEFGVPLAAGPLPVVAELDALISPPEPTAAK
jgi:hypothetical protein